MDMIAILILAAGIITLAVLGTIVVMLMAKEESEDK